MRNAYFFALIFIFIGFLRGNAFARTVYIYDDKGVSSESLTQTVHTMEQLVGGQYNIKKIDANGISKGKWIRDASLLIITGGRGKYYSELLNGKGNQMIREYIINGGSYLGICAGAYHVSNTVQFDKDGPLEVLANMELQFFNGQAIGPLVTYAYGSNSGARAATIAINADITDKQNGEHELINSWQKINMYYNGGSYFKGAQYMPGISVLGWYTGTLVSDYMEEQDRLPAIIHMQHGGGTVILSGLHLEYDYATMNIADEHLAVIAPRLKSTDSQRIEFMRRILHLLGL